MPEDATFKIIRDPVHDIIRIRERFVLRLLDAAPMQRLRRVRQLGLAWLVFPGAEHSRFTHSLGAYYLAGRVMAQLDEASSRAGRGQRFDDGQRRAVLATALLHDVGHGPFSHVFELALRDIAGSVGGLPDHEAWTVRIVKEEATIRQVLAEEQHDLPDLIGQILGGAYTPYYVKALVSSQLDVDRFDYLLRDSLMTGTRYGAFDLEWMLRTLDVRAVPDLNDGAVAGTEIETIVVDGRRGLSDVERYVLGRHHTYRNVYYHKTVRAAERMLRAILSRAAALIRDNGATLGNEAFRRLARGEKVGVDDYLSLDDFRLLTWIDEWSGERDKTLADLCGRLTARRLSKAVTCAPGTDLKRTQELDDELRRIASSSGWEPQYYVLVDDPKDIAYKEVGEIWYVDRSGRPAVLSSPGESAVARTLREERFEEHRWVIAPELVPRARSLSGIVL